LAEHILTAEKLDHYCDSLARELVLSEARQASEKRMLVNHILMFAAARCQEPEAYPQIPGVSETVTCWPNTQLPG
jgi:hypothetical protein